MPTATFAYLMSNDPQTRRHVTGILSGIPAVTFMAGDDEKAVAQVRPDLILVDEALPVSEQVIYGLHRTHHGARLVRLTSGSAAPLMAGISQNLPKPVEGLELYRLIRDVQHRSAAQSGGLLDELTPRERQILDMVVFGSSNKEVGLVLRISPRTVEVHRARIMQKTGARNAADLARIVLSQAG